MKTDGWIEFKYKLPYSAIEGRTPPYDFPILVAIRVRLSDPISYEVSTAKEITEHYNFHPEIQQNFKAWRPIDEYIEPRN